MSGTVLHVVGARPNFMKAAPVMRALADLGVPQQLVHTGQHYDFELSAVFFRDLGLPEPDWNLKVGSGSHAEQTSRIMVRLEKTFAKSRPRLVVVYGDVNSTVAAALVASKLCIPLAHVEAGLRSFDNTMPEEINRKVTDLLSELLFVTSPDAIDNLRVMGIPASRIYFVGNPMIDSLLAHLESCDPLPVRASLGVGTRYVVVTLHRPGNVDNRRRAGQLARMLEALAEITEVVFPVHPRGEQMLRAGGVPDSGRLRLIAPLGYLEFIALMRGASAVITDSGGIQEETTVLGVPCLTVRPNTERPITIVAGTNRLVEPEMVPTIVAELLRDPPAPPHSRPPLWDGQAGRRIAQVIQRWLAWNGHSVVGRAPAEPGEAPSST